MTETAAKAIVLAFAALACAAPDAHAQSVGWRLTGYVTLTSDYRRRGLSQSDGGPALQVGGDFEHATGFFAGASAATVEYERGPARRAEVAYYAGYAKRLDRWSFAAMASRYTYAGSDVDYDYEEWSGSVGYRDKLFFTASSVPDLLGRGISGRDRELALAWPLRSSFEVGAAVGRFDADAFGIDYTYWNAGVSKTVARFAVDLRYYDNDYELYGPLGDPEGRTWVISASYGFAPR